jgi:hypothetical protein
MSNGSVAKEAGKLPAKSCHVEKTTMPRTKTKRRISPGLLIGS